MYQQINLKSYVKAFGFYIVIYNESLFTINLHLVITTISCLKAKDPVSIMFKLICYPNFDYINDLSNI